MKMWAYLAVLSVCGTAAAQSETVVREPDRVTYKKITVVEIDGAVITAENKRPAIETTLGRPRFDFESRVKVRLHFDPELQGSVDNL